MREVDGLKVAFVDDATYFAGFTTPSMTSTARDTGADLVLLLAPGKSEADVSDNDIRALLAQIPTTKSTWCDPWRAARTQEGK